MIYFSASIDVIASIRLTPAATADSLRILNKPISEMDNFQHENTCLYQFEYYDNSFSLVKANDLAHLRD